MNEQIDKWLLRYTNLKSLENRTINVNENNEISIDINTSIELLTNEFKHSKIKELPYKFNIINGTFSACDIGFTSFKNFPNYIKESFHAYGNNFQSTDEIPLKVFGRDYFITSDKARDGGNNISLDFIKELDCSKKIELILIFSNSSSSIEFINTTLLEDYQWILKTNELTDVNTSEEVKDIYLNYNQIQKVKEHALIMSTNECEDYLNNFDIQNGINNDKK